jgi:hypothetical protein
MEIPDGRNLMSIKATTEGDILKQCLEYLHLRGWHAWRNNSGGRPWTDRTGKTRLMRFGAKGSGDILAVRDGVFLSLEVKKPGGKVSDDQKAWIDTIRRHGGLAFVVRSVDELMAELTDH